MAALVKHMAWRATGCTDPLAEMTGLAFGVIDMWAHLHHSEPSEVLADLGREVAT